MLWFCVLAMSSITHSEVFDHEMDGDQKRQTGIYKLSNKEKAALQYWVDANYEKRKNPVSTTGKRGQLEENLLNGSYIKLSNGTIWNIHPDDRPITQGWITAVDIIESQSGDPNYPVKLTNSLTGSSVRARQVREIPKE
jgi:hypothetical protein